MSANETSCLAVEATLERFMLRHSFRICFHSKALHGLQRRSDRLLIWLGPPHFRVETLINLAQGGIVRANGGHCTFGILRWSRGGRLPEFVVSIFIFVH